MSGEWWVPTVGRRVLGVSFLEGFFDSSMVVLAQAAGKEEPSFGEKFFSWSGPLDGGVWAMVLMFAFVVGLAYGFIESGEDGSDLDRDALHHNYSQSIFSALLLFTGGGGHAPRSFPGQLLLFGWSLFVLVLVNGYAANLVAFLVKVEPPLFKINDIDDAVTKKVKICTWSSSAAGEIMKSKYPEASVVPTGSSDGLQRMREGECDATAHFMDSWNIQQGQNAANPCCDIFKRGDMFYSSSAGWAINTDSGVRCTSIIRDVLDIFLVELKLEGFIADAQQRWLPVVHDNQCSAGGPGDPELECAFKPASEASDSDPLVIDDFMGIFVLTAIFIVVSVVWSVLLKRFAAGDEGAGQKDAEEVADHEQDQRLVLLEQRIDARILEIRKETRKVVTDATSSLKDDIIKAIKETASARSEPAAGGDLVFRHTNPKVTELIWHKAK